MSSDIFILTFIIYFVISVNSEKSGQNRAGYAFFYNFKNPGLANYHHENGLNKMGGLIRGSYGIVNKNGKLKTLRYSSDQNGFMRVVKTKKPKTKNKESNNGKDEPKFMFPKKNKFFSWDSLEEWWKQPGIDDSTKTKFTQWNLKKEYIKNTKKNNKWSRHKHSLARKESKPRYKKPYKKSSHWKDKLNNKEVRTSNPSFKEFF